MICGKVHYRTIYTMQINNLNTKTLINAYNNQQCAIQVNKAHGETFL